jgi:hypothetical protein
VKGRECHYWHGISTPLRLAQDTLIDCSRRKEFDRRFHSYEKKEKNDKRAWNEVKTVLRFKQEGGWLLVGW